MVAKTKITVEIRSPEGESATLSINPHETVQALKQQSITALDLRPASGAQYFLFLNGRRLTDGQSLTDAGVTDGAILVLATEPQVGGR